MEVDGVRCSSMYEFIFIIIIIIIIIIITITINIITKVIDLAYVKLGTSDRWVYRLLQLRNNISRLVQ